MERQMSETTSTPDAEAPVVSPAKPAKQEDSFPVFVLKLAIIVIVFRSFIFSPFNIPSESMLPRMRIGDYLLVSKWSYGFSRHSLPFSVPLLPEKRLLARTPARGDIVVFKQPPLNDLDYIKRVIGLPGDTIQMISGVLHINGQPVPKVRLADEVIPVTQNMIDAAKERPGDSPCKSAQFIHKAADGTDLCRYPRYRETLPEGKTYEVLDLGPHVQDNYEAKVVPEGHLFLMGDHRDNSEDSRFPAEPGHGIGLVPMDNLVGRATVMMWSTDGSAEWIKPWTWFSAARWDRMGGTF
jgi:signal peptidase I